MSKFFKIKKANKKVKASIEYYVKSYFIDVNKDSWEHGETDQVADFSTQTDNSMINKGFNSVLDAANSVLQAYYMDPITDKSAWIIEKQGNELVCQTETTVDLNTHTNEFEEVKTTEEKYKQFKNGEIDLYAMIFVITLGKRQEVDFDESEF